MQPARPHRRHPRLWPSLLGFAPPLVPRRTPVHRQGPRRSPGGLHLLSGEASDEHLRLVYNSYPTISSFRLMCFKNSISPLCREESHGRGGEGLTAGVTEELLARARQLGSVADQRMERLVVVVVARRPRPAGTQEGDVGCRRVVMAPSPGSGRSWVGVGGSDHPPHHRPLCSSVAAPRAARMPPPCNSPPASKLSLASPSRVRTTCCVSSITWIGFSARAQQHSHERT